MSAPAGLLDRSARAPEAAADVRYLPMPSWVRDEPPPSVPQGPLEDFSDHGVLRILFETQTSLMEPGVALHVRILQRILTRAGAERAANLAIEFDPVHERLEIHSICVHRSDERIEHARDGSMHLLRRESQLERLVLNGRLTASLVVPDLREGDLLEIRFTQFSWVPVLWGRYGSWLIFNAFAPWIETRLRLIRPPSRPIALKPFNGPPTVVASAGVDCEELRWSVNGQRRIAIEDLMPTWTVKNPCYQASEFTTWSEVARVFTPHYEDDELPEGLVAAIAELASSHSDQATLAVEWLRFVQRAMRYFALAFGVGGLLPSALDLIWTRRFGDCKDAARLYVAGARRLGLDSCAALVSTTHGLSLHDFLPSAQVFDHVIVRLRIGGETYWVDPTLPLQGGSLRQRVTPHAGWALPLTTETVGLEALPTAEPVQLVHCEDRMTCGPKASSPAQLVRQVQFSYWAADNVRHRIANDGATKFATQLMQELLSHWPRAVETTPPSFEEDAGTNRLTVRCGYEIREPWTVGDPRRRRSLTLVDTVTNKELAKLKTTRRHSPIFLGRPRRVSWRVTVEMPRRWRGKGWSKRLDESGMRFSSHLKIDGRAVVLDRELVISAWSTAADQAEAYVRIVAQANVNLTQIFARVRLGRIVSPVGPWQWLLASRWRRALLILGLFILYVILANL